MVIRNTTASVSNTGRGREAIEARRENDLVLSGEFSGIKVAYLDTQRDLGVTLEICNCMPAAEPMSFDGTRMTSGKFTSVVELGDAK